MPHMTRSSRSGATRPSRTLTSLALSAVLALVATALAVTAGAGTPSSAALSAAAVPPAPPTTFRIGSFNILGASHTDDGSHAGFPFQGYRARMERTVGYIDQAQLSVVGLQEFHPRQYDYFRQLVGKRYELWPDTRDMDRKLTENSIAWRPDIWTAVIRTSWSAPYFGGDMQRRPLVLLRHNLTGQQIWVMNTHSPADTYCNPDECAQPLRDRHQQIAASVVNQLRAERPDVPVFYTGDMNDREQFYCPFTASTDMESAAWGHNLYNNPDPTTVDEAHEPDSPEDCGMFKPAAVNWIMASQEVDWANYTYHFASQARRADWTNPNTDPNVYVSDHAMIYADAIVPASPARNAGVQRVVVVDVPGLKSSAVSQGKTPHIAALRAQGASTLNARTLVESTRALPNAVSLLSASPLRGGHGVSKIGRVGKNTTVHKRKDYVYSVFDMVRNFGGSTGFYSSDPSGRLLWQSWNKKGGRPDEFGADNGRKKISSKAIVATDKKAVKAARKKLAGRTLSFVHLGDLSEAGTGKAAYNDAVAAADKQVGRLVGAIRSNPATATSTLVIVTSDTGGVGKKAGKSGKAGNFTVPVVVWGPTVPAGGDLYAMNPRYTDPGSGQPSYGAGNPIRVGGIGNLALSALSYPAVVGSQLGFNPFQDLQVFPPNPPSTPNMPAPTAARR